MDGGRDGEPDNVIPHASRRDCFTSKNICLFSDCLIGLFHMPLVEIVLTSQNIFLFSGSLMMLLRMPLNIFDNVSKYFSYFQGVSRQGCINVCHD